MLDIFLDRKMVRHIFFRKEFVDFLISHIFPTMFDEKVMLVPRVIHNCVINGYS